ncbi:galactose-1-phosphate uridylyltransferase, partial [Candidatus Aerophobetes bacterium]
MNLFHYPHRRFNALTGEWILVSPQRTNRPWQGSVEEAPEEKIPPYDPKCYLCPGNERAGGVKNPKYKKTFVFTNDFSTLLEDTPAQSLEEKNIFKANAERGKCKVICFSPRHDLTLALMENADIKEVIDVWINQCKESEEEDFINYIQIFENRGPMMGCSNPHPHGQIWSSETVPVLPTLEGLRQKEYYEEHSCCLLCNYLALELDKRER